MKKRSKALRLHRETLRSLDLTETSRAAAGAPNTVPCVTPTNDYATCSPTCRLSCVPARCDFVP